jgi:hypothetical protein
MTKNTQPQKASAQPEKARLEYLRGELRAERISYGEIAELQSLAEHIEKGDVELLEAAGVPETAQAPEPAQHSPLPWVATSVRALSIASRESGLRICTMNSDESKISEDTRKANVNLIIRAVNSVERLAEALRDIATNGDDFKIPRHIIVEAARKAVAEYEGKA